MRCIADAADCLTQMLMAEIVCPSRGSSVPATGYHSVALGASMIIKWSNVDGMVRVRGKQRRFLPGQQPHDGGSWLQEAPLAS